MPETYTLNFQSKHRGRPKFYEVFNNKKECLKQADILLDSFETVQIIKNKK